MRAARINRERRGTAPGSAVRAGAARNAGPAKRRRGPRPGVIWAASGFIAGAVFWHAVGFWSFISDVVFNKDERTWTLGAAEVAGNANISLPTIFLVDPANCTALALDRSSNSTLVLPCPKEGLALRLEPPGEREDLTRQPAESFKAAGYQSE
jgi:hypothetical protein